MQAPVHRAVDDRAARQARAVQEEQQRDPGVRQAIEESDVAALRRQDRGERDDGDENEGEAIEQLLQEFHFLF